MLKMSIATGRLQQGKATIGMLALPLGGEQTLFSALGQTWGNGSDPWWVHADLPSAGQLQPGPLQATYCAHPVLGGKAHPQDAKQSGLQTDSAFTLPLKSRANWALHAFVLSPAKS